MRQALASRGFGFLSAFATEPELVLALARALGPLYHPSGVDPIAPVIETHPNADAAYWAPFDGAEAIGWHNDFSTHQHRAEVSLAYLARADPEGTDRGAWRVASGDDVIGALRATSDGAAVIEFLLTTDLPFSFTGDGDPILFRVLEERGPAPERLGLRFYGRALRDGACLAYGEVPTAIEHAVASVELAADRVGQTLLAPVGSVLVTHNWHALHDRLPQTVGGRLPLRRSLLCFVESIDVMLAHERLPTMPAR